MEWWQKFLEELAKPAWAAGLLQATIATALAFLGAYWLVRRQIFNDQEYARLQLEHDEDEAVAARRREAASAFADSIVEFEGAFPFDDKELGRLIVAGYSIPELDRVRREMWKAAVIATELLEPARTRLTELQDIWMVCHRHGYMTMTVADGQNLPDDACVEWVGAAARYVLAGVVQAFTDTGYLLKAWDGYSDLDLPEGPSSHERFGAAPDRESDASGRAAWERKVTRAFMRQLAEEIERATDEAFSMGMDEFDPKSYQEMLEFKERFAKLRASPSVAKEARGGSAAAGTQTEASGT